MPVPSTITADIELFARDIYLNTDLVANNRVEDQMDIRSLEHLLQVAGLVQHPEPILEMGFGTGLMLHELTQRHRLHIDLLEGSAALCAKAKQLYGPSMQVYHSYFETFAAQKKYRNILAMHVLEHVDDPVRVLQQMRLALQPAGRIIILVPNAHSLHRQLAVQMQLQESLYTLSPRDHLVGHQRVFDLEHLADCATQAGLRIEQDFGFGLKTLPYAMMEGWKDDLLRACVDISPQLPTRLLANIGLIVSQPG